MSQEFDEDRKRNSLLLLADVVAGGRAWTVKVRNISAGGLMAEPCTDLATGSVIKVELPNVGQIGGKVAWIDHPRFGVTFDRPIDHRAVRGTIRPAAAPAPSANRLPLRRL